jgi:HTH-type transcriptional regulator / antitoxin HigA
MEIMGTTLLDAPGHSVSGPSGMDVRRYGRLLAKFTPKVIETEAENEEALAVVEALLERGESNLRTEESALLNLLVTLIEKFERSAYALPEGDPAGALEVLMEGRALKPIDLSAVFGSRARVSEVLSRKRAISKEQAKRLAEFFGVSPAAFI